MGEGVYIIGNIPLLGMWNADHAVKLYTSKDLYPCWKVDTSTSTSPSQTLNVPLGGTDTMQFGFENS